MRFRPLAGFTAINICLDISMHGGPPIVVSDVLNHLEVTIVSSKRGVVVLRNDITSKFLVEWNINAVLEC